MKELKGWTGAVVYAALGIVIALLLNQTLGFALSTDMPVVAVVSGSMYHGLAAEQGCPYCVCGKNLPDYENTFDSWWDVCKDDYISAGINKSQFESFLLKDGFAIGDMPVIQGSDDYQVGDVIVFDVAGQPAPIIHRIIKINSDGTYQTHGDHNAGQNPYEFSIKKEQIHGKTIFIIPKLGYFKVVISKVMGEV